MNILNAVRGQPLARKTLVLSLLAALCTLHARTALPDTPPGTAPASVSEAAPDLTPLTSTTNVPTPSDDGAGTLGASTLQPGVSSILARLSPAIIYVPPVVTDPVDLAILDARKAMQANNLAAFDTAAALIPRGHALSSYLDYWRLRIRLAANDATDAEYLAVSADAHAYLKQPPPGLGHHRRPLPGLDPEGRKRPRMPGQPLGPVPPRRRQTPGRCHPAARH